MTANFSHHTAAGCASARVLSILDAAIILVVSVCAVLVRIIGLWA